jgi:cell division GTPase FtsZ
LKKPKFSLLDNLKIKLKDNVDSKILEAKEAWKMYEEDMKARIDDNISNSQMNVDYSDSIKTMNSKEFANLT